MLLHAMSSVFRGTLSPWLGCSINLVCLGITLWLLLRLGRQLADVFSLEGKGRQLGILAVLLYGMSTGALATVLLIRMYGLLSCLCAALFSVHVEKWKNNGFDKKNKGLIAITVLGFLTQYFFLFYLRYGNRRRWWGRSQSRPQWRRLRRRPRPALPWRKASSCSWARRPSWLPPERSDTHERTGPRFHGMWTTLSRGR